MSAKTCPKVQVCLRALINNQTVPLFHPNGCHLCCHHRANRQSTPAWLCFNVSKRCNPNQLVSHYHLHRVTISKESKKQSKGNVHWHLIVKPETTQAKKKKAYFLGVKYMKSDDSGSLDDRGLNWQKRICKLSECFVPQRYHSLVKKLIIQETSTCHLSVTNQRACNKDRTKTNYTRQH